MKIVVADQLSDSALTVLSHEDWTIDARAGRPRAELERDLADADGLVVRSATRVDAALLEAAPRLKVVARAGTGVDNVDLEAASARGVLVVNVPGANSVSVAEHAFALMLATSRSIAGADAAMKQGRWEKRALVGAELRGKTLGIVGLGRVGQEVAGRARAFGLHLVAFDPYISRQVAADLDVELVSLDELCARADLITLHLPSSASTRHLFDAQQLARCKPGVRLINTARGDLIDETALADAIEAGRVAGAGLDVFGTEPPVGSRLAALPQVVATPHIAASTREAQELVGQEALECVRDYLRDGLVRNAVNFPSVAPDELRRLRPFVRLAERLGALLAQLAEGRPESVRIGYYGTLAAGTTEPLAGGTLVGTFGAMLSTPVTPVNARAVAAERGVEVVESRTSRPRHFTSLLSVKLVTTAGEWWAEGAVFEPGNGRLVLLNGVEIEAALEGTLIVVHNVDQPGVIGALGTILGRHAINIASFALGRNPTGAVAVINVDEGVPGNPEARLLSPEILEEIRALPAVTRATLVRL